MELIDKSAVVAEIKNLLDKGRYHEEYDYAYRDGNNSALYTLEGRINTLEVKEINPLTWEDMMLIHKCIKDAMNYHLYKMMEGMEGQKIVYEEVLKRFKAQKGE